MTVICATDPSEAQTDAVSTAAAEIVADFPDCTITEDIIVDNGPLTAENLLVGGWVYRRAE